MNLFFNPSKLGFARLLSRTVLDVAEVNSKSMREILVDHDIPPHCYKEAFRQLVVGCALGGGTIDRANAEKVEDELGNMAAKEKAVEILAGVLVRQVLQAGYDHKFVVALATEILGLAAEAINIRKALEG